VRSLFVNTVVRTIVSGIIVELFVSFWNITAKNHTGNSSKTFRPYDLEKILFVRRYRIRFRVVKFPAAPSVEMGEDSCLQIVNGQG